MIKYADINNVYNICECTNEYIKIIIDDKSYFLYFFEIDPIVILNKQDKYTKDILDKYEEFLRGLNFEFQIIIDKLSISLKEILNIDLNVNNKLKERLRIENEKNINEITNNSTININKYYLIVKSDNKIDNIDIYMSNLKSINLNITSINDREKLEHFIMKGVGII